GGEGEKHERPRKYYKLREEGEDRERGGDREEREYRPRREMKEEKEVDSDGFEVVKKDKARTGEYRLYKKHLNTNYNKDFNKKKHYDKDTKFNKGGKFPEKKENKAQELESSGEEKETKPVEQVKKVDGAKVEVVTGAKKL